MPASLRDAVEDRSLIPAGVGGSIRSKSRTGVCAADVYGAKIITAENTAYLSGLFMATSQK
jgi:hypothetical protein